MKKSILYILAVAAGLYSCEPYKDLHESIQDDLSDQRDNEAIPAFMEISADDQVFFSMKEAQEFIPSYLDENYQANAHTDGRVVEVTYTVEAKNMTPKSFFTDSDYAISDNEFCKEGAGWVIDTVSFENTDVQITLEESDYDYLGFRYPNFSDDDFDEGSYQGYTYDSRIEAMISDVLETQRSADRTKSTAVIFDVYDGGTYADTLVFKADTLKGCAYHFLPTDDIEAKVSTIFNTKYPDQAKNSQSAAVYKVGEIGGEITEYTQFFQNEEAQTWLKIEEEDLSHDYYTLVEEDYDRFGFRYPNFSSSSPQENYLPQFLAYQYPYAQEGENLRVKYDYYSGSTNEHIVEYTLMSGVWTQVAPFAEETVTSNKFKYKHAETTWVISQAIIIELTSDDYKLTGDDRYNNFGYYDNVEGEYPEGTPVDNVIDAKINEILKTNYADINIADQEVSVFYLYYDNGTNTVSRNYIYDAASESWVRQ